MHAKVATCWLSSSSPESMILERWKGGPVLDLYVVYAVCAPEFVTSPSSTWIEYHHSRGTLSFVGRVLNEPLEQIE